MIAESDLYAMAMESPTAWHLMPKLCEALGIDYPPSNAQPINQQRESMADPIPAN